MCACLACIACVLPDVLALGTVQPYGRVFYNGPVTSHLPNISLSLFSICSSNTSEDVLCVLRDYIRMLIKSHGQYTGPFDGFNKRPARILQISNITMQQISQMNWERPILPADISIHQNAVKVVCA